MFSTLSPWPFWAGSETYWFDLVTDGRAAAEFEFHARLADSPATRAKACELEKAGAKASFYKHYNVELLRRNVARIRDKLTGSEVRRLPWYDEILKSDWDLVWFAVDGLRNLGELEYAVSLCKRAGVPYWLQLQHGYEDFFLHSEHELAVYEDISLSAKRFVFISERNRNSLERAIGRRLDNAFHSQNALPAGKIAEAAKVSADSPPNGDGRARFFNLGRFSPKDKGQHLLLEALGDASWRGRDWGLSFVGVSGYGADYLKRLVGYFGIEEERIEIISFTDGVFDEIGRNDVLLMPSLAEGTPYAMIESMACGRPAVGTPIGGIPELITDGETGWLAKTVDIADIAEALKRMWADRGRWAAIGGAARARVASRNNEETVYREILEALTLDTAG